MLLRADALDIRSVLAIVEAEQDRTFIRSQRLRLSSPPSARDPS
jgi:hypothetical protein